MKLPHFVQSGSHHFLTARLVGCEAIFLGSTFTKLFCKVQVLELLVALRLSFYKFGRPPSYSFCLYATLIDTFDPVFARIFSNSQPIFIIVLVLACFRSGLSSLVLWVSSVAFFYSLHEGRNMRFLAMASLKALVPSLMIYLLASTPPQ